MSDTARDSIYRDVISSGRARDPLSPHCILPTRVRAASLPLSELLSSSGARKIASAPAAAERLDMDPAIFITGSEMAERYSPRKHPSLRWTVSRVIHRALAKFATDRLLRDTYGISDPSSMDFGARCCKGDRGRDGNRDNERDRRWKLFAARASTSGDARRARRRLEIVGISRDAHTQPDPRIRANNGNEMQRGKVWRVPRDAETRPETRGMLQ